VTLHDPEVVRREYATDERLSARRSAYRWATGRDPHDAAFLAVAEVAPRRVLEVGCGRGDFDVVAVDQSEQMVDDAYGWIEFPSRIEAQAYVDASVGLFPGCPLPGVDGPLRVRRAPTALVATTAA
jgi:hypothetical protein